MRPLHVRLIALYCLVLATGNAIGSSNAVPPLAATGNATAIAPPELPIRMEAGPWNAGHVQGIAVDRQRGHVYYSFTRLLAKYDFDGRLLATLDGWHGHFGDLDFNPDDGRLYGSLEYGDAQAFYIAVVDTTRMDRVGMDASAPGVLSTVLLPEVGQDFSADLDGDGQATPGARSADHRYGSSGIDGVAFGPAFGRTDGPRLLTVAYGIYANNDRSDNDHQVLLQYDIGQWASLARPLDETALHHSAAGAPRGKYFVRTGNTTYGVQNLAYDTHGQRWLLGTYKGRKPTFPNYTLFAVEAHAQPQRGDLVGVQARDQPGWEQGLLLPLPDIGLQDPASGIRGWHQKTDVGLQPLGDGLFYLATNLRRGNLHSARVDLVRWTGAADAPFAAVGEPVP